MHTTEVRHIVKLVRVVIVMFLAQSACLQGRTTDEAETTAMLTNDLYRTWTSAQGSTVEATLVYQEAGKVVLDTKRGPRIQVAPGKFSPEDQQYLLDLSYRAWTPLQGRTVEARILYQREGKVVLETRDGQAIRLAARELSPEERRYLRAPLQPATPRTASLEDSFEENLRGTYDVTEKPLGALPRETISPRTSSDGLHLIYGVRSAPQQYAVVLDGHVLGAWDALWTERGPQFSPDGNRVAFVVRQAGQWSAVVDGQVGEAFDEILEKSLTFDQRGRRFAYMARKANAWFVVVDDDVSGPFNELLYPAVQFSNDGQDYMFAGKIGGKTIISVDQRLEGIDGELMSSTVLDSNGRRLAYVIGISGKLQVVVDGERGPVFHKITRGPTFSEDSRKYVYVADRDGLSHVVVDGAIVSDHEEITFGPSFDLTGKRFGTLPEMVVEKAYHRWYRPDGIQLRVVVRCTWSRWPERGLCRPGRPWEVNVWLYNDRPGSEWFNGIVTPIHAYLWKSGVQRGS